VVVVLGGSGHEAYLHVSADCDERRGNPGLPNTTCFLREKGQGGDTEKWRGRWGSKGIGKVKDEEVGEPGCS